MYGALTQPLMYSSAIFRALSEAAGKYLYDAIHYIDVLINSILMCNYILYYVIVCCLLYLDTGGHKSKLKNYMFV